jgi:hypothetical protein
MHELGGGRAVGTTGAPGRQALCADGRVGAVGRIVQAPLYDAFLQSLKRVGSVAYAKTSAASRST